MRKRMKILFSAWHRKTYLKKKRKNDANKKNENSRYEGRGYLEHKCQHVIIRQDNVDTCNIVCHLSTVKKHSG